MQKYSFSMRNGKKYGILIFFLSQKSRNIK